jgi:hypothetical protein
LAGLLVSASETRGTGRARSSRGASRDLLDPNLQALELGLCFAHGRERLLPFVPFAIGRSLFAARDASEMRPRCDRDLTNRNRPDRRGTAIREKPAQLALHQA